VQQSIADDGVKEVAKRLELGIIDQGNDHVDEADPALGAGACAQRFPWR
jgi:hypothetical protein